MTDADRMLTLADAAEQYFGGLVSVKTLREACDRGDLQAFKIGRHWWTTRAAIGEMAKCLAIVQQEESMTVTDAEVEAATLAIWNIRAHSDPASVDSSTLARAALEAAAAARPRQIEAAVKAIAAVWESHGDGYLSPGLFEAMAKAALEAAAAARPFLDTELPVAISRLYDEIDRLRASNARLLAAVEQMLAWEHAGGDGWWKGWEMLKAAAEGGGDATAR